MEFRLNTHILTGHENKKAIYCNQCEMSFAHNETLQSHVERVHLKLRPYKSQHCNKTCVKKIDPKKHIKIHHKL